MKKRMKKQMAELNHIYHSIWNGLRLLKQIDLEVEKRQQELMNLIEVCNVFQDHDKILKHENEINNLKSHFITMKSDIRSLMEVQHTHYWRK